MWVHFKSQGICLGFLMFLFTGLFSANANENNDLSFQKAWERLIYFNKEFKINNSSFLLSYKNPSPEKELELTLKHFQKSTEVCKYPARYIFLLKHRKISKKIEFCDELKQYWELAPSESIKYVLASRSVSNVTSMMGHGFIVTEGYLESESRFVSHSYSFYTEIGEANSVTIAFDAFIGGMRGSFALRPYAKDINKYLKQEKREIWELYLNLNDYEKNLLKNSLWELKDTNPTYFFQSFNCATLVLYSLSIINPKLLNYEKLFVSPEDIYKALRLEKMVGRINTILPEAHVRRSGSYEPLQNPQDSIFSLNVSSEEKIVSFTPASHTLRTIFPDNKISSQLKLLAFDYEIKKGRLKNFYLFDYIDLKDEELGASKAVSFKFAEGSYKKLDKFTLNSIYLIGLGKENSKSHFGAFTGLGINFNDGLNSYSKVVLGLNLSKKLKFLSDFDINLQSRERFYINAKIGLNYKVGDYQVFIEQETKKNNFLKSKITSVGLEYYF